MCCTFLQINTFYNFSMETQRNITLLLSFCQESDEKYGSFCEQNLRKAKITKGGTSDTENMKIQHLIVFSVSTHSCAPVLQRPQVSTFSVVLFFIVELVKNLKELSSLRFPISNRASNVSTSMLVFQVCLTTKCCCVFENFHL